MVTTEDVAALRRRHAEAQQRQAQAAGRREQAQATLDALTQRMQADYGCATIEELEAKIEAERVGLAAAYSEADAAITAAEQAVLA